MHFIGGKHAGASHRTRSSLLPPVSPFLHFDRRNAQKDSGSTLPRLNRMAVTPLLRFIEAKSIEFCAEPTSFAQDIQKSALFWSTNQFDVRFPRFPHSQDVDNPTPLLDVMNQFVEAGGSLLFEPASFSGIPKIVSFLGRANPIHAAEVGSGDPRVPRGLQPLSDHAAGGQSSLSRVFRLDPSRADFSHSKNRG